MSYRSKQFEAAVISQKFHSTKEGFVQLLKKASSEKCLEILDSWSHDLAKYQQQDTVSVAFIGEYSAGKSTIISALTGRRDIHIDSDIATSQTTSYDWNGIKITDTPGLFTERRDHDAITYDAISKADLLVFCLTYMLFDSITIENFKKIAYEQGYQWKTMLLVNKMSAEAGEESEKIKNYRESLSEALKPYSLDKFSVCFIDAKDYCEGIDENDEFLLEVSRFDDFIKELNTFVSQKSLLSRLDTPIRITLDYVARAQITFDKKDTAYLEILARLNRRINQERLRLRNKVESLFLDTSSIIRKEGQALAHTVGEDDFKEKAARIENKIKQHYEQLGQNFERVANEAYSSLEKMLKEEFQSDLVKEFVAQLEFDQNLSRYQNPSKIDRQRTIEQIKSLQNIGSQFGAQITKMASKNSASLGGGFLNVKNVAGSQLHKGVYDIGKFVGFKFKPWQAANIAKNIGNFAKVIGPAIAVLSIGVEIHNKIKEVEEEKKISEARQLIENDFYSFTSDLESQVNNQLREFETQLYSPIETDINNARKKTETENAKASLELQKLGDIRDTLEQLIKLIENKGNS